MADITWPTGKYRLLTTANIPRVPGGSDELLPEGTEIEYAGKPAIHMRPLDNEAYGAYALAGLNPLPEGASISKPVVPLDGPTSEDDDARLARVMGEAFAKAIGQAIGQAFAELERRGVFNKASAGPAIHQVAPLVPPPAPPLPPTAAPPPVPHPPAKTDKKS